MPAQRVVIIGGGFAGLSAVRALRDAPVEMTIIDRHNHHIFQPLLYQVATASLSPADIAAPIRHIVRSMPRTRVVLGEARAIDAGGRRVVLADGEIGYDYLVVAAGVTHSYFGREDWAPIAPGLKDIDDALEIRRRFLLAFESAEREADAAARRAQLTFVIVGAGPTGVELAGAMAEIARKDLPREFRAIDTATARVIVLEGRDRVLPTFPESLSERARRDLERLGVEVRTGAFVTEMDPRGVTLRGGERIESANAFWAAGVRGSPLAATIEGARLDGSGRVGVGPDLSVPGRSEVFIVGDLAAVRDDRSAREVPGVAPAAMQMGRFAGRLIAREVAARAAGVPPPSRPRFRYVDKGSLATIGRAAAVGDIRGFQIKGVLAWLFWALVHVLYLIGFRNRIIVMLQWAWAWITFNRSARLITGDVMPTMTRPVEAEPVRASAS